MFQLKYLECRDFFSFDNVSIRFTKGMLLITGYDELGKDSNGCGKSTILNAICWALFGRTLKGVQGQDVVRWGCKNCKVILLLEGEEHIYEIQRSLDSIRLNIDNTLVRGHIRDIQSTIETTFKTNYSLFIRSTAFSQSQVEFLAASGDAEKKKLFKEILSLSRLDKAYDKIRNQYDLQSSRAERFEGELEAIHWQKNNLENKIHETESLKANWEISVETKANLLRARQQQTPPSIETIKLGIIKLEEQLAKFQNIENDILGYEKKVYACSFEDDQARKEIFRLSGVIEQGPDIGQRCEVCGNIVNKKMLGAHKKELEQQILDYKKVLDTIAKDRFDAHQILQQLYETRLVGEGVRRDMESKNRDLAIVAMEWEHYKTQCIDIDKQIEEIKNDINPYSIMYDNLSSEFNDNLSNLENLQTDFENTKRLIDTLSFLKFVLSREGAVGHIIEREYSTLMSYSNRMLSEISGGRLRLSISPQRELKSGALKEEIEIVVYSNEQKTTYWG